LHSATEEFTYLRGNRCEPRGYDEATRASVHRPGRAQGRLEVTRSPRSPGRPSAYSEDLADLICERLVDGESLRLICSSDLMPNRSTVLRWLVDHEEFREKYEVARMLQAEGVDDKINELIDTCTPETASADRVKLAALQWRVS
jgi:hypothetical protein